MPAVGGSVSILPAMPTPGERRALLFFASIALLGAGWRVVRATGTMAPSEAERTALGRQIAAVDSARLASARGQRPPRSAGGRTGGTGTPLVDIDRATARELEALPRIGPALAERIVADRDSNGPFGSLEALQRVRGIGAAMAREIAPRVTFSAPARTSSAVGQPRSRSATRDRVPTASRSPEGQARSATDRPSATAETRRSRSPVLWPIPPPIG